MRIIIPMAGQGTRLRPQTLTLPKPLFPIANKSIVEHLIALITQNLSDIESVHFVIHPSFGAKVEERLMWLGEQYQLSVSLHYQQEALGTAHAVYQVGDALSGPLFIAFADTLFISSFQFDPNLDGVIWCKEVENPRQFGVIFLDSDGYITRLVEKPEQPESNLAITGVYYIKEGERLRSKILHLLENDIRSKGEYQLTDALMLMIQEGARMRPETLQEWLDCGNRKAILETQKVWFDHYPPLLNREIEGSIVIPPVCIHESALLQNCVIGPYVSIGPNVRIINSVIQHSIIREGAVIEKAIIHQSLIGAYAEVKGKERMLDLSDYSRYGEVE